MDDLRVMLITQAEEAAKMAKHYADRIQQLEAERDAAYALLKDAAALVPKMITPGAVNRSALQAAIRKLTEGN